MPGSSPTGRANRSWSPCILPHPPVYFDISATGAARQCTSSGTRFLSS